MEEIGARSTEIERSSILTSFTTTFPTFTSNKSNSQINTFTSNKSNGEVKDRKLQFVQRI